MKMKINRACDLTSISVLPPHCRPNNAPPPRPQLSQIQSQQHSQHSFSQGFSSQQGIFSQLSQSQNSLDDGLMNDQRFGSQERESTARKNSSMPPMSHSKDENNLPISRYSTNCMRKWGPAVSSESRCQVSEDLEHKIGSLEASLIRFGITLDSIQSDVMQLNKRTKELTLEVENVQQKLINQDSSIQLLHKTQADVKVGVDGCLRSISNQPDDGSVENKLQEVLSRLSSLPAYFEELMPKLEDQIARAFTKEMQASVEALSILGKYDQCLQEPVCPSKVILNSATPVRRSRDLRDSAVHATMPTQGKLEPDVEMTGWKSVKKPKAAPTMNPSPGRQKVKVQWRDHAAVIECDEEINSGFSCLLDGIQTDTPSSTSNDIKLRTMATDVPPRVVQVWIVHSFAL
ncbi:hypothetical protein MLD38_039014 [Melastoma candidum]|uniref:Uncharacterized protein n=1 Tax=Melastoma candidum TaxID=119954 RepID=A0ACB9L240_9MYRT|nr:hypothetical protein MLD38_039014 [Melastoma candidum]